MKKFVGRLGAVVATVALAITATGCSGNSDAKDDGADLSQYNTVSPGKLKVVTNSASDAYIRSVKDGKVVGFEPDLVRVLAKKIGFKDVEFVGANFDTIFSGVAAGKYDFAAAGTTGWLPEDTANDSILKDRNKILRFTRPTILAPVVVVTNEKYNKGIKNVTDLPNKSRVSINKGTTTYFWGVNNLAKKGYEIIGTQSDADVFNALDAGLTDATLVSKFSAMTGQSRNKNLNIGKQIPELLTGYSFTLSPKNDKLRESLNKAIAESIKDGSYDEVWKKYFPDEKPAKLPTESYSDTHK